MQVNKQTRMQTREMVTAEEQQVMAAVQREFEGGARGREAFARAYARMGEAMRATMRQVFPTTDY